MPKTNKRTCSTWAVVASELASELRLPFAWVGDAMCCMVGENRDAVVREENGLEIPAGAKSRLACMSMGNGGARAQGR
jgi:hypothetical protein